MSVMQPDLLNVDADVGGTKVVVSLHKEGKLTVRWPHAGSVELQIAPATAGLGMVRDLCAAASACVIASDVLA